MGSSFLDACRKRETDRTPVWYMRQAGRYLPEYRELRERHGILEICRTPELAAEVTLMPVRRLGVDAAILFSDIMIPVAAMGIDDGATPFRDVFREMGIEDRWILTPKSESGEIRRAFRMFSQSAIRASQHAGAFSRAAAGGFFG